MVGLWYRKRLGRNAATSDPFTIDDKPSAGDLHVCYRFPLDRPLDADEAQHPASDEDWWAEHIATLNRELLGDLREAG